MSHYPKIRLLSENALLATLICLNTHSWWGGILFIAVALLILRPTLESPDYLILDTEAKIQMSPMHNRWY